jgi:uncharacterized protein YukE
MDDPLPFGAVCAEQLGRPHEIRELARTLSATGTGMEQLLDEVRRVVVDLVPRHWEGEGAKAFRDHPQPELDAMKRAAERTQRLAQAAVKLANRLDEAWAYFARAIMLCVNYGYTIGPPGEQPCEVIPLDRGSRRPSRAEVDAGFEAEGLIRRARGAADLARIEFRLDIAADFREQLNIVAPLASDLMAAIAGGGRLRGSYIRRGSLHRPHYWHYGEIVPSGDYGRALRQLRNRGAVVGQNYGVATYDPSGNIYFRVVRFRSDYNFDTIWNRHIGNLPPRPPGMNADEYGRLADSYIRGRVEHFDGGRLRRNHPNANGPDLWRE